MRYRNFFIASLSGSLIFAATTANAAFDAYMTFTGSKQGQFKGGSTKRAGTSEATKLVTGFDFSIETPRDAQTGLASGKRQHKPIVITKLIDTASPQIFQALSNNELLPAVRIDVYDVASGKETLHYTITLSNAQITGDKRYSGKTATEDVSLTYQKITITWAGSSTAVTDTWQPGK